MEISVDFEKADMRPAGSALGVLGVVFEPGSQLYMWYVEILVQTNNDVDRTFTTPSPIKYQVNAGAGR
jgi:hypothetical protein